MLPVAGKPEHLQLMNSKNESDIDEQLEFLELQENTAELDDLVCNLRHELQGIEKPLKAVATNGVFPAGHGAAPGGKGFVDYVIQPLPSALDPTTCTGHFSSIGNFTDEEEDVPVQHYLKAVMERLSRLEHCLEEWKTEQHGWMTSVVRGSRVRLERRAEGSRVGPADEAVGSNSRPGLNWELLNQWSAPKPRGRGMSRKRSSSDTEGPHSQDSPQSPAMRDARRVSLKRSSSMPLAMPAANTEERRANRFRRGPTSSSEELPGAACCAGRLLNFHKVATNANTGSTMAKKPVLASAGTFDMGLPRTHNPNILTRVVNNPVFDYFFASMILLNSLFIGVQTEYKARNIGGGPEPDFFDIAEKVFAGLFAIELLCRMVAYKTAFFHPKTLAWNVFDMVLVTMSAVEIILNAATAQTAASDASSTAGKVIRMFRMARIVRIMRVLRFLAELRIMVTLIMHSARSLFWLMILLILILYIFAIFFTQGVTDLLEEREVDDVQMDPGIMDALQENYGSMLSSAYTLFASITGGVSWRDVLRPLSYSGFGFAVLFLVYVFFCVFSVLNIVTGVFVDGAIQRSSQERDLRLEKEKEQKNLYVSMLRDLLEEIDSDATGVITREDLQEAFKREDVKYYFSVLDINVTESDYLFDMLDLDRSGEVDMEEFVNGCLRLKGNAKSIDIHTLMHEIKLMIKQLNYFMDCCVELPSPAR